MANALSFQLVTAADAAARLAVSRATFYRLVKRGEIGPGIKFGLSFQSARRWPAEEIEAFGKSGVQQ